MSILGLALSTTSDSLGAFHLGGVPAGPQTVTVRKVGFGPISTVLTFAADDALHIEFTLVPTTTRLPEVNVKTATPVPTKLSAFEERRKRGFGHRGASGIFCYLAVVLDGIFVYQGNRGEKLFDINSLHSSEIAGVEVYHGGATIPAQYEGMRTTCGLVIIWTK